MQCECSNIDKSHCLYFWIRDMLILYNFIPCLAPAYWFSLPLSLPFFPLIRMKNLLSYTVGVCVCWTHFMCTRKALLPLCKNHTIEKFAHLHTKYSRKCVAGKWKLSQLSPKIFLPLCNNLKCAEKRWLTTNFIGLGQRVAKQQIDFQ